MPWTFCAQGRNREKGSVSALFRDRRPGSILHVRKAGRKRAHTAHERIVRRVRPLAGEPRADRPRREYTGQDNDLAFVHFGCKQKCKVFMRVDERLFYIF